MTLSFKHATLADQDIIFEWLAEPHMIEFWDNSLEHKDDILNFLHNRKQTYFAGTTQYWIGYVDGNPFAFLLSDILQPDQNLGALYRQHMSPSGHTISLDFGIGNTKYLSQGLASPTLEAFVRFYHDSIDPLADTFSIDPDENNPRANHVYTKAGFQEVGTYDMREGAFKGSTSYLMVKKLSSI